MTAALLLTACGAILDFDDEGEAPTPRPDASDGATPAVPPEAGADATIADAGPDAPRPRVVFVTGGTTFGGLGGIDGGDDICNEEAASAGLTGTFVAYLRPSIVGQPWHRLPDAGDLRWRRVDGTLAFSGSPADQTPLVPVSLTADGGTVGQDDRAWTGAYNGPLSHCSEDGGVWLSTGLSDKGACGSPSAVGNAWQSGVLETCNTRQHIYCFER